MGRWKIGGAEIEALVSGGELQKLTGEAANGELFARQSIDHVGDRPVSDRDRP